MEVLRENERRQKGCPYLTESEIDEIATKAADRAVEKMTRDIYQSIGHSVVRKFFWIVGASAIGFAAWLHSKGFFH